MNSFHIMYERKINLSKTRLKVPIWLPPLKIRIRALKEIIQKFLIRVQPKINNNRKTKVVSFAIRKNIQRKNVQR